MVTLIVFLGFEIFRLDRTMTDLKTRVTSIAGIARFFATACKQSIIVVIVNDNDLTNDLFKSLVVTVGLPTPLNELFETNRFDLLTNGMVVE